MSVEINKPFSLSTGIFYKITEVTRPDGRLYGHFVAGGVDVWFTWLKDLNIPPEYRIVLSDSVQSIITKDPAKAKGFHIEEVG